ncbi:SHOCT domain-containing protein [Nocardioides humilatus]|uniref:SHOCT domain-containing protein n=1 Tax=Nocardioides humilatus TaxID=2607660 RepID=A0A5B1L427_9ACTN|nr:SHOCT domain-containing protein [Nocardioides humilatus]KAA1415441.1 SHOCT domain-containing protein [Nocardioides humilatus]
MSTPSEQAAIPQPSFIVNFIKTLAFMLVCGIVGPIFLIIYLLSGGEPLISWMLWTGLGITILDVAIAFVIALGRTKSQEKSLRLHTVGRRGVAEVVSVEQTGVRINDQPLLELHVRIHGDDMAPFEAQTKSVIPDFRLPLLYAGPMPVLVDPTTQEWEFDWDAARPAFNPGTAPGVPYQAMPAPAAPVAAGAPDQRPVEERLAELDSLLQRDLIGREEYDAARARILGAI